MKTALLVLVLTSSFIIHNSSLLFADTIGNDPYPVDLNIQAGEDFRVKLALKSYSSAADRTGRVMNLNGYAFRATAATTTQASVPFASFSTVVIDAAAGKLELRMSKARTTANTGKSGYWDLLQTDPAGLVKYLFKGVIKFISTVTR